MDILDFVNNNYKLTLAYDSLSKYIYFLIQNPKALLKSEISKLIDNSKFTIVTKYYGNIIYLLQYKKYELCFTKIKKKYYLSQIRKISNVRNSLKDFNIDFNKIDIISQINSKKDAINIYYDEIKKVKTDIKILEKSLKNIPLEFS